jgi:tRNA-dihydrouridine synthase B
VRGAVSVPVTVKMRLGWDDATRNAPDLARRGIELLPGAAVHRDGGVAEPLGPAGEVGGVAGGVVPAEPLVANGDVASLADAQACLAASGADAVMVGRAAVGRSGRRRGR